MAKPIPPVIVESKDVREGVRPLVLVYFEDTPERDVTTLIYMSLSEAQAVSDGLWKSYDIRPGRPSS